jgi:hypothetical protein
MNYYPLRQNEISFLLFMVINFAINLTNISYVLYYTKIAKPAETCCNEYWQ